MENQNHFQVHYRRRINKSHPPCQHRKGKPRTFIILGKLDISYSYSAHTWVKDFQTFRSKYYQYLFLLREASPESYDTTKTKITGSQCMLGIKYINRKWDLTNTIYCFEFFQQRENIFTGEDLGITTYIVTFTYKINTKNGSFCIQLHETTTMQIVVLLFSEVTVSRTSGITNSQLVILLDCLSNYFNLCIGRFMTD